MRTEPKNKRARTTAFHIMEQNTSSRAQKHFLCTIEGPDSSYSAFDIHICISSAKQNHPLETFKKNWILRNYKNQRLSAILHVRHAFHSPYPRFECPTQVL